MKKKKPLFIAYTDIHHHDGYQQFNQDHRRIKISMSVEREIFEQAKDLGIPTLFVGDWVDNEKHITNELFHFLLPHILYLNSTGVKWYGISGNHDQSGINLQNKQSFSYVATLGNLPNFMCLDFFSYQRKFNKTTVNIVGIPYITNDQDFYKILKQYKPIKGVKNILMLHTTLPETKDTDGRLIQTNTIGKKEMRLIKRFDLVLVGHIHKPMLLADNILQLGATNQQRKTDRDCDLGYYIIYDDLSFKFKKAKTPKFIELEPGETIPNEDNFYYHKIEKKIITSNPTSGGKAFKDIEDRSKIAKSYLKEKGIKNKVKKQHLIEILRKNDNA